MATSPAAANDQAQALARLASTLAELDAALRDDTLAPLIGRGLTREFMSPLAAFRQRFPDAWPARQPSLF